MPPRLLFSLEYMLKISQNGFIKFFQKRALLMPNLEVIIKRSRTDWHESPINVEKVHKPHWDNCSGGIYESQRGYSLYGYIDYSLAEALVACSGSHEHFCNEAKIMIPANLNSKQPYKDGYNYLKELAGKKPKA